MLIKFSPVLFLLFSLLRIYSTFLNVHRCDSPYDGTVTTWDLTVCLDSVIQPPSYSTNYFFQILSKTKIILHSLSTT